MPKASFGWRDMIRDDTGGLLSHANWTLLDALVLFQQWLPHPSNSHHVVSKKTPPASLSARVHPPGPHPREVVQRQSEQGREPSWTASARGKHVIIEIIITLSRDYTMKNL